MTAASPGFDFPHLPTTKKEMAVRGWTQLDVLLITGDAYFDHPSHGAAVIGRVLEEAGYRVGIIARPNWQSTDDFTVMGTPALFVGITAGAVDSMLNNYTADLAKRRDDAYAPGKQGSGRPNMASVVYTNKAKEAFGKVPIVLGGVEASTRRFAYFDYLKGTLRRSILLDSRADLLVFGPGEKQALEVAHRLAASKNLSGIPGTARLHKRWDTEKTTILPSFQDLQNNPALLIEQIKQLELSQVPYREETVSQQYEEGVVVSEIPMGMTTRELDKIHELPFNRKQHPSYEQKIPALETVKWSVIALRGCPGGCSFCAISMHQGRRVIPRTASSVLHEIEQITQNPEFKGTITDIGGPTANAYAAIPRDKDRCLRCKRPSCLHPKICSNIETDHTGFLSLLQKAKRLPGIKHLLVASGIRHDLALQDKRFIRTMAAHHTGGHLKVAPEHVDPTVLHLMRKPSIDQLEEFERIFKSESEKQKKEQYLVPYFIAGFPGCTQTASHSATKWLRSRGQRLQQTQTYIPLPGTMAAAMYFCQVDPKGAPLHIPNAAERKRQKRLLTNPKEPLGKPQSSSSGIRRAPTGHRGKRRIKSSTTKRK